MNPNRNRCAWAQEADELMREYHDRQWGIPIYDDNVIFEFLCLESFQSGLSWRTILHKRENFRRALAAFDPVKVSKFGKKDFDRLMNDVGIVRNRAKIEATIHNAHAFLKVQQEFGTFSTYMWNVVDGKQIVHTIRTVQGYNPTSAVAVMWAKDLKKRGFKFLGPTTIYSHMQATGMVNDHMVGCFKR